MPSERERLMESRPNGALPKGLDEAAARYTAVFGSYYGPTERAWLEDAFKAGAAWREALSDERQAIRDIMDTLWRVLPNRPRSERTNAINRAFNIATAAYYGDETPITPAEGPATTGNMTTELRRAVHAAQIRIGILVGRAEARDEHDGRTGQEWARTGYSHHLSIEEGQSWMEEIGHILARTAGVASTGQASREPTDESRPPLGAAQQAEAFTRGEVFNAVDEHRNAKGEEAAIATIQDFDTALKTYAAAIEGRVRLEG